MSFDLDFERFDPLVVKRQREWLTRTSTATLVARDARVTQLLLIRVVEITNIIAIIRQLQDLQLLQVWWNLTFLPCVKVLTHIHGWGNGLVLERYIRLLPQQLLRALSHVPCTALVKEEIRASRIMVSSLFYLICILCLSHLLLRNCLFKVLLLLQMGIMTTVDAFNFGITLTVLFGDGGLLEGLHRLWLRTLWIYIITLRQISPTHTIFLVDTEQIRLKNDFFHGWRWMVLYVINYLRLLLN